ncbi:MAG TPA: hypothetical protein VEU97_02270 [Ktedonobacteraceae bacterium]|nr:hypothetical protein [Ktedonobacteraceae bacterium]
MLSVGTRLRSIVGAPLAGALAHADVLAPGQLSTILKLVPMERGLALEHRPPLPHWHQPSSVRQ